MKRQHKPKKRDKGQKESGRGAMQPQTESGRGALQSQTEQNTIEPASKLNKSSCRRKELDGRNLLGQ